MNKRNWLTGLGLLGACALCCVLPLIGGAVVLGMSAFFLNPVVILSLLLVLLITAMVVYQRRKTRGSSCLKSDCSCNSCVIGRE